MLCMTAIGVIKLKCGQLDIVKVNLLWDTHVLKNLNGEILEGPSNCEITGFLNYKYTHMHSVPHTEHVKTAKLYFGTACNSGEMVKRSAEVNSLIVRSLLMRNLPTIILGAALRLS